MQMTRRATWVLTIAVLFCMVWFCGVGRADPSPLPGFANPPQSARAGVWVNSAAAATALLHPGANSITVRLDTTLLNQMVALKNEGLPAYQTGPTPLESAPSGLLGPVALIPASLAVVHP
jgi:hypothetical protein